MKNKIKTMDEKEFYRWITIAGVTITAIYVTGYFIRAIKK